MDTNQIVKDLMRVERMKADRFHRQKQIIGWQKEQYRSTINSIRSFRDRYFDILRTETNLTSAHTLHRMTATSSDPSLVSVTAAGGARAGETTFRVIQSAAAATAKNSGVTTIQSSETVAGATVTEGKNTISLTLNGRSQNITVQAGYYATADELKDELQIRLDEAFGAGKIQVNSTGGRISFSPHPHSQTAASDTLAVSSATYRDAGGNIDSEDILSIIAIKSGTNNRLNLSDTLETVSRKLKNGPLQFNAEGSFTLTINSKNITINETDTLSSMLNKINNSGAGVKATYSSFSDTFTITAAQTGAGEINIEEGGNFPGAFALSSEAGRDAVFEIDGVLATRASNTFTVDGITYTIRGKVEATGNTAPITINVTLDTDTIYNTITKFVEDYNSLIEGINNKIREERFRDFPPLTDEQKEAMSEKEIEQWEQKAKSGLLRSDPALEKMLRDLRSAIFDSVDGSRLSDFGIEVSSNWRDNGKLVLKNGGAVLREAINRDPDKLADFFSQRSAIPYSDSANRRQRYAESGLAHRLNDILNDNIRTTRDSGGRKGVLLEKAGIEGDSTHVNNLLDRQLRDVNRNISRVEEMLKHREEQYYRQFTAMEKALQELYSQGDWLSMHLNQGVR
jgi:flagellar hook-associated protein 2